VDFVKVVATGERGGEQEPKRRRTDGPGLMNRLSKHVLIALIGVAWSAVCILGGIVYVADQKWRGGLEAAVAQSNSDAQGQVLQRLTTNEAELRAIKEANVLRAKADDRRDRQMDDILTGMGKLTNRLDVYIAIHDRQARGER
jgi:hypothetical protein